MSFQMTRFSQKNHKTWNGTFRDSRNLDWTLRERSRDLSINKETPFTLFEFQASIRTFTKATRKRRRRRKRVKKQRRVLQMRVETVPNHCLQSRHPSRSREPSKLSWRQRLLRDPGKIRHMYYSQTFYSRDILLNETRIFLNYRGFMTSQRIGSVFSTIRRATRGHGKLRRPSPVNWWNWRCINW